MSSTVSSVVPAEQPRLTFAQDLQFVAEASIEASCWYNEDAQTVHLAAPWKAYVGLPHRSHSKAAIMEFGVDPSPHCPHCVEPLEPANVPSGHLAQRTEPFVAANIPIAHASQRVLSSLGTDPEEQFWHCMAAGNSAWLPGGQREHSQLPSASV